MRRIDPLARAALAVALLLTLASCGADGSPERPEAAAKPGVTMTGSASIGIAKDGS